MFDSAADRVMIRQRRLDDDFPAPLVAAGATGDLREQLESALAGAKVRQVHGDVGIYNPDQCHEWKIEPLRDHLRTEQNVDFATLDAAEDVVMRPFR
jgi:hypothetical protein